MGAISALSDTGSALTRNPVLFGAALIIGIAAAGLTAVGNLIAFLGLLAGLVYFFVEPLLAGGFLGMANEAISGETDLGAFWEHGKENYADLLVGRIVVAGIVAVTLFAVFVVSVFVVGFGAASTINSAQTTQPGAGTGMEALIGSYLVAMVLWGAVALVLLVGQLIFQFYPAAIVLGDAGALESFKYSYRLFREHPLSVLGYTALVWVVGLVGFLPGFAGGVTRFAGQTAFAADAAGFLQALLASVLVATALMLVVKTLLVGVFRTYYVAFVRSLAS